MPKECFFKSQIKAERFSEEIDNIFALNHIKSKFLVYTTHCDVLLAALETEVRLYIWTLAKMINT